MKSGSFPHNLGRGEKFVIFAIVGTAAVIVFGTLFGLLVQFLWNATLVELLGQDQDTDCLPEGDFAGAKLFFGFGSSVSRPKKSKKKPEKASHGDDDNLMQERAFRDFWEREGKAAYEAYKSSRDDSTGNASDENK